MNRVYSVYKGEENGFLVYIGTTMQKPSARFRWHKANGKPLNFTVLHQFDNPEDMLDKEFELIQKYKPALNKIIKRKQNFNAKLSYSQLEARRGDAVWCQCCFKRRVNVGYKKCAFCK